MHASSDPGNVGKGLQKEWQRMVLLALLLGIVAGLRTLTAPAAASWGVRAGLLSVTGTPLAFMGFKYTPIVLTILAIAELVGDKLPKTPSRKSPPQFTARVLSGGLVGATVGAASGAVLVGLMIGAIGAVAGTYGGAAMRSALASAFGKDLPAALFEDTCAIVGSILAIIWL